MKIINKRTNEVITEILNSHSVTVEEAIECAGEMHWDEEDKFQAVTIDGTVYDYDDLDVIA